jgi:hypothetical protein
MNPSKEEIEKSVGESIPDGTPVVEVSSLPDPEKSEGLFFRLAGTINNKWKVFLATKLGSIVSVYLLLITLGADIPKPIPLSICSFERFQAISADVYAYLAHPTEKPVGYLASLPKEYQMTTDTQQTSLYNFPIGTGIAPVSGRFLD